MSRPRRDIYRQEKTILILRLREVLQGAAEYEIKSFEDVDNGILTWYV